MTGLCFALFGLGGLTLSLVWFNLLLIFQRDRTQRRRGTPYYFCQFSPVPRGGTRCRGTGLPFQQSGRSTRRAGCLVIANHPSLLDYVLLASVMNETDCLVKARCCVTRSSAA